jgi:choline dehydrogenase-like flavoprotein
LLLDSRDIEQDARLEADLCICGGGAAGIALALAFEDAGLQVCLLESGALHREAATQDLYAGRNESGLYADGGGNFAGYLRSTRSRFLGGSSNCWGGWCRPYDAIDFEARDWVAHSGWPITRADLQPWYERAQPMLQLGPYGYDPAAWSASLGADVLRVLPLDPQHLTTQISQFSPPLRMGHAYRARLARARNLLVVLHANVVALRAGSDVRHVAAVQVRSLGGRRFTMQARCVVLAAGGIENARLLLASNEQQAAGLGNGHDLVGRYFMEHAAIPAGRVVFAAAPAGLDPYDSAHFYLNRRFAAHGTMIAAHWGLSPAAQRAHGVLNSRSYLRPIHGDEDDPTVQGLVNFYRWASRLFKHRRPTPADFARFALHPQRVLQAGRLHLLRTRRRTASYRLEHIVEASPDPQSRVLLDHERDALGMPRARLQWRPGAQQKRTIAVAQQLIGAEFARLGLGRVEAAALPEQGWPDAMQWVWHHLGTTRMHDDPRQGVVDADCRVHGLANLYVAGSSVFPTAGTDAPTLTIVALALRLAEHLRMRLREDGTQRMP